jgi:hypothetical protein
VLEGKIVEPHRDRDASYEGGVILSDEEHGVPISMQFRTVEIAD